MTSVGERAKAASLRLLSTGVEERDKVLASIEKSIQKERSRIILENQKDIAIAKRQGLKPALIKRLQLDNTKVDEIVRQVKAVRQLPDPVGRTLFAIELDRGLELYQVSCPIGVIAAIFEARPDALVQIACLALKSGNAVILKGGSEAMRSNRALAGIIIKEADALAKGAVQLLETREEVAKILGMERFIDLLIPRGSAEFVRYIQEHSRIPVLGHSAGICHVYVDKDADLSQAAKVCYDAKCQYPSVCNAMETLLVHKDVAKKFLPMAAKRFAGKVSLRGDPAAMSIVPMAQATEEDWATEYNDLILSVKVVGSLEDAIVHINRFGSKHTEAIVTMNARAARRFMALVDASSVMWNASTRFADGYRYGKGAEVGISTAKIHARGPVGLEGLTIYKYILVGKGHKVADYSGKNAKKYTHRRLMKEWRGS